MKNVIKDGPLENLRKPGHAVANIGLDVAIDSSATRNPHLTYYYLFTGKSMGNSKNPDLIGNIDKGSGDIDGRGNWKITRALGSCKHDHLDFVWVQF